MKHAARLALSALCLAAGCKVGPNYVKPSAPTPNTYKAVKGWKVAQPRDDMSRGKWWTLFNDPVLTALAEKVQISNQNLAVAEAQFRQARAVVRAARSQLW